MAAPGEWSADERRAVAVAAAAAAVAAQGAARMVPLLVSRSSRYERSADLLGLYCALLASLSLLVAYPYAQVPLYWLLPLQFAAYVAGAWGLARLDALRYVLAGRTLMSQRVRAAAEEHFARLASGASERGNGTVLLYVSFFERQVVVLADDETAARLRPGACAEIRDLALKGLREGQGPAAICRALEYSGQVLAETLPRAAEKA